MRAPAFWWRRTLSPPAALLWPVSAAYGTLVRRRLGNAGILAPVPVICIGNFTAGGAGKTPTALALAALLWDRGERPAFLSRGYGGRLPGPIRVNPAIYGAADVGDEPLLLARSAPTVVARDRVAGARLAAAEGASVVVMDDGLQNPSLAKDLSIAVVEGATGIGNGLVLPAGPLRAAMAAQWPRVDAVLVVGPGEAGERIAREAQKHGKPVLHGTLVPEAPARIRGLQVLAFAGIGRPEKFFATLEACGAHVAERRSFPDHHPYRPADIAGLAAEAQAKGLTLVTTEKDFARLTGTDVPLGGILTLPVRLEVQEKPLLDGLVMGALARRRALSPSDAGRGPGA